VTDFRELGRRLSNWGRWGDDDERGTLNLVRPEHVAAAARCVRRGVVFELSVPIGPDSPPWPGSSTRVRPMHVMTALPTPPNPELEGLVVADDWIAMPLQGATQWDGLAHVGYDGYFYNRVPVTDVTAAGARRLGIDHSLPGMVGRGVLLDVARLFSVPWLPGGTPIGPHDLEAAERAQGVSVGPGDFLLLRTGWRRKAIEDGWGAWHAEEPGLSIECAAWLREREVAAVAADNHGVEVVPTGLPGRVHPLHCVLIRDMGMWLGEVFDFEALAEDCAADGVWESFFSAPVLRIPMAVGSPTSPTVVK
jgi:kynurenine formamidase